MPDLERLRNLEEFAALGQFLFCFGTGVLGLPDFGREELETALLEPSSPPPPLIISIQMALLKMVSSHRGLVPSQFEEYTRRQYLVRQPQRNPFGGTETEATRFGELPVEERVRVLHQLSVWAFLHPERVRDKMKDADEKEQLSWRIEPCGFDAQGNTYYILDDNRLYRRTPWIQESTPIKKVKSKQKASKRRRVVDLVAGELEEPVTEKGAWSYVCVSLHDWTMFVASLEASKDPDENALHAYLKDEVLPELTRAWTEKEKERQLQDAVANRKRSSRLDAKLTRQKEEEEKAALAQQEADLVDAVRREKLELERKEKEREIRAKMREQKVKERELRKLQGKNTSRGTSAEDSSASGTRRSSRRAKIEPEKTNKGSIDGDKEWIFDCVCGTHGINYEDGTEIIGCDSCDVWQHLNCQKLPPGAENEEFVCDLCKRYGEAENGASASSISPQVIKLRIGPPSPEKAKGGSLIATGTTIAVNSLSDKRPIFPRPATEGDSIAVANTNPPKVLNGHPAGMGGGDDVGSASAGTIRVLPLEANEYPSNP